MSTGEDRERIALADEAVRIGRRARVAAVVLALAYAVSVVAYAARVFPIWFLPLACAAFVAGFTGLHALWHCYHYGHTEGRAAGMVVALLTFPGGVAVVVAAVLLTGGPGAGRVRRITAQEH